MPSAYPNQSPQAVRKVLARLKYPVTLCKARRILDSH